MGEYGYFLNLRNKPHDWFETNSIKNIILKAAKNLWVSQTTGKSSTRRSWTLPLNCLNLAIAVYITTWIDELVIVVKFLTTVKLSRFGKTIVLHRRGNGALG